MSQSVTFYPIDSNDFAALDRDLNNLDLLSGRNNYQCFQGTHEGLRFVLSKGITDGERNLVNEIFYPTACMGKAKQIASTDPPEELQFADPAGDEDDDFEREPVFYHDPEKVRQIAGFLHRSFDEHFATRFDPEELNREGIYPCCWNNNQDPKEIYNERHFLEDYQNLKELFAGASTANSYLLCFVG